MSHSPHFRAKENHVSWRAKHFQISRVAAAKNFDCYLRAFAESFLAKLFANF